MLDQHRSWWTNIKAILGQRLVFAVITICFQRQPVFSLQLSATGGYVTHVTYVLFSSHIYTYSAI